MFKIAEIRHPASACTCVVTAVNPVDTYVSMTVLTGRGVVIGSA